MPSTISVDISVTDIGDEAVGEIIADKLWNEDNIEGLAESTFCECSNEEREDALKIFAETILSKIENS